MQNYVSLCASEEFFKIKWWGTSKDGVESFEQFIAVETLGKQSDCTFKALLKRLEQGPIFPHL